MLLPAMITDYFRAIERGDAAALAQLLHPDVVQEELPNRFAPQGAKRGASEMLAGLEKGRQLLAHQQFEILHALAEGDQFALEVLWTGKLAIGIGELAAGDELKARLAIFLELREGRIAAQRNYDCYL